MFFLTKYLSSFYLCHERLASSTTANASSAAATAAVAAVAASTGQPPAQAGSSSSAPTLLLPTLTSGARPPTERHWSEYVVDDDATDFPVGWEQRVTAAGTVYYVDHINRRTTVNLLVTHGAEPAYSPRRLGCGGGDGDGFFFVFFCFYSLRIHALRIGSAAWKRPLHTKHVFHGLFLFSFLIYIKGFMYLGLCADGLGLVNLGGLGTSGT